MKRLLDIVSGIMGVLCLALGWRVTQVMRVAPPVFGDVPQTVATKQVPPPVQSPTPRGPALESIVKGNLFETERGFVDPGASADGTTDEPLPPPTNVVLNGVFYQMSGRPMAIMTDTSAGNRQLTLQTGDNLGEYQVGDITRQRVMLLGRGGQEFSLELDIKKGAAVAAARPQPAASARTPPTPPAARPGAAAAPPTARSPAAERVAQTAAQRAAEARRQQALREKQQGGAAGAPQQPDATQARLEALRRLRESARQ